VELLAGGVVVDELQGAGDAVGLVASGQFWGQGTYTPGAPKGRFPLAISVSPDRNFVSRRRVGFVLVHLSLSTRRKVRQRLTAISMVHRGRDD
jgi:hypothetical protein